MSASKDRGPEALEAHRRWRGKIQVMPKCPIRGIEDFALWYTPGVAAASRAIAADPAQSWALTARGDMVAIVSDGSRVLGLGDIGPEAAMPVMEGKALLFKHLGAVDAVPLCVDVQDEDALVAFVEAIAPSFGAVNLEDISAPKCFRVLARLQASLSIPVWHDDQQGTAAAVLGGLWNALAVVGKRLEDVAITLVGIGAANHAVLRLLRAAGADPARIIACDSAGTLHEGRADIAADPDRLREKWQVCRDTNPDRRAGGIREALIGADVCIAFSASGPDVIAPDWIAAMAPGAIVFACANPTPEIWPDAAHAAGAAIVATGRSDFPNQVNNALIFPGLFRGVLDARAPRITDAVAMAAAKALADHAKAGGISAVRLLPSLDDIDAAAAVAGAAAAAAAQTPDLADPVRASAARRIRRARAGAAAALAVDPTSPLAEHEIMRDPNER